MDEAIDPITGYINWDCPCLGNNTKGPCGELFKIVFKLFVKSQNDPGITFEKELIEMQNCFKKYTELYK